MKAFLLAAGLGTRLRPLTDTVPKCLVEICGVPLLEQWFQLMLKHGIDEFLINTHHLAPIVENFVREKAPQYGLRFHVAEEPELLGSAGTIIKNKSFVEADDNFFVLYADNLTDTNLTSLLEFHVDRRASMSIALFHMDKPETRGIAQVEKDGSIVEFIEKPANPIGDLANGGIYVMAKQVLATAEVLAPNTGGFDIGMHLIPHFVGNGLYGLEMNSYLRDIGSMESLNLAQGEWQARGR